MNYNELSKDEQELIIRHRLTKEQINISNKGVDLISYVNNDEDAILALSDKLSETGVTIVLNKENVTDLRYFFNKICRLYKDLENITSKNEDKNSSPTPNNTTNLPINKKPVRSF